MVWTPTTIDMYMDDVPTPYFHADLEPNAEDPNYDRQLVFGKPNFIIANLAVGGNFPGIFAINQITALADGPRSMYIDWIRIYQRGDATETFVCPSPSDPIEQDRQSEGLEPTSDRSLKGGEKVLQDGQLLIRRGEHIYTPMGQMLK